MNLALLNLLGGAGMGTADAIQRNIINQQNQQQINDRLASDALLRQIQQAKLQDYLSGEQGAGAFYRSLAAQPVDPTSAPAPAPGQNSAQKPAPLSAPAPAPGQNSAQPASPAAAPTPVAMPGADSAQFTANGGFSNIRTPQQVMTAVNLGLMRPQQGAAILKDMTRQGVPVSIPLPGASPMGAPPAQSAQPASPALPLSDYNKVIDLAKKNQIINLAGNAAAQILKSNPGMSDRQLGAAMGQLYPALTQQSDNAMRLAGLSNTELFKTIDLDLRQQSLNARYPYMANGGAYSPELAQAVINMAAAGQLSKVPVALRGLALATNPDLGQTASQGEANLAATKASALNPVLAERAGANAGAAAQARLPWQVQATEQKAPINAAGKAYGQVTNRLAAIEPAY
ncbi:MAG: hypothetical protein U7M05_12270, partial [Candidatus Igneacidithiobacillus chanchocoensis]